MIRLQDIAEMAGVSHYRIKCDKRKYKKSFAGNY